MTKRTKIKLVNILMLISLIAVLLTGFLVKPFPSMWMGIGHAFSGVFLTICIFIHCMQHRPMKKKA